MTTRARRGSLICMSDLLRQVARAVATANGIDLTQPPAAATSAAARPKAFPKLKAKVLPSADRVVLTSMEGVMVRVRDGRLPRDGDVQPDGAGVRLRVGRRHALVVASLRWRPAPGSVKWVPVTALHVNDRAIVEAAAPHAFACLAHTASMQAMAAAIVDVLGDTSTGSAEDDLRRALTLLRRRVLDTHHAARMVIRDTSTDDDAGAGASAEVPT